MFKGLLRPSGRGFQRTVHPEAGRTLSLFRQPPSMIRGNRAFLPRSGTGSQGRAGVARPSGPLKPGTGCARSVQAEGGRLSSRIFVRQLRIARCLTRVNYLRLLQKTFVTRCFE